MKITSPFRVGDFDHTVFILIVAIDKVYTYNVIYKDLYRSENKLLWY